MQNVPNYSPNPAYQRTMISMRSPRRMSALKIVLIVLVLMFALLAGLATLALIGFETGAVGFLIGLTLATIPVPFYILLVLWLDRYESEPLWLLATAFFWGALVAVFIAMLLNTISGVAVGAVTGDARIGEGFSAIISAPVVEESSKALVLFSIFFFKRDEFDGVLDGIVYATMVGLGFAMTENVLYYGRAAAVEGLNGSALTFVLRGVMFPYAHPLFTSMTGIALGFASISKNFFVKYFVPLLGLTLAVGLHMTWNLTASLGGGMFLLAVAFVMIPMLVGVMVAVILALIREWRIVRDYLRGDVQRGLFAHDEYVRLCTIHGRMGASFAALKRGGISLWRTRMDYHRTASELAFHRNRVARGLVSADQLAFEREAELINALHTLRQTLA